MGLNKDSMDAARELPQDPEPDVVGFDLQVTMEPPAAVEEAAASPEERSRRISADYGRRNSDLAAARNAAEARCKAELDARGFDLAMDWDHAMEADTAAYYSDHRYQVIEEIVRHCPAFAAALRAVHNHVEDDVRPHELGRCCVRTDRGWPEMLDEPSYPA